MTCTLPRGLTLTLFALGLAACGTPAERPPIQRDCAEDDVYELKYITEWTDIPTTPGTQVCNIGSYFCAPDDTPPISEGATLGLETIPAEDVCAPSCPAGGTPLQCGDPNTALVIRMSGNHDWGSLIGTYTLMNLDQGVALDADGEPYEGLSFWAKQIGDLGFTISLNDRNTVPTEPTADHESCIPLNPVAGAPADDRPTLVNGYPAKGTCGNNFQATVTPTPSWKFYTIPFNHFTQELWPNRIPSGIDPVQIYTIGIRGNKDTTFELWLDSFAWYKKKPATNP